MNATRRSLRVDTRPLYAKTVEVLYEMIEEGAFQAGQPLPSEEELRRQLGVSRSTLREAVSHLEKDGLIIRRHGIGTFVTGLAAGQLRGGLERLQSFRVLAALSNQPVALIDKRLSRVPADAVTAETLHLPLGSELLRVQVVEGVGGCQTAYLDSLIPPQLVDLEALRAVEGSLLDYLVEHTEMPLSHTRSEVYAIDAVGEVAQQLGVPEGKSLLHLVETLFNESNEPIMVTHNYFITDCFGFYITRRVIRPKKQL
jgi:GntR family transcriptional regulator